MEMGASFQIKLRYQNPQKQVVKLLAIILCRKDRSRSDEFQIENSDNG